MPTLENLEAQLQILRNEYKLAKVSDRRLIEQRAKLLEWAIEKQNA